MFYVLAVSFYTTLNFALWPDLSTPETIGTHTALGVGIVGGEHPVPRGRFNPAGYGWPGRAAIFNWRS